MRKLLFILLLCPLLALSGVNKTLGEAQRLLNSASTIAQFQTAKKKFQSAKYDVAYVAAEHDAAINQGIANCNRRIDELSPRLTVSPISLTFGSDGGTRTLTVSTNQGTPNVSTLPSWITLDNTTNSSITIRCSANSNALSRSDWFAVNAGNKSVRIDVTQQPGRDEKLEITNITFGNSTSDGTLISKAGETLYVSDMKCLSPLVGYRGLTRSKNVAVSAKIYRPNGRLIEGATSGFTYANDSITFSSGVGSRYIPGWGDSSTNIYTPGTYRYELWIDGKQAYSTKFTIVNRETTYLYVKNNAGGPSSSFTGFLNLSFDAEGGTRTFSIETDGAEWTILGVPSFCEITSKTPTSMTLRCNALTTTTSRSDCMKIRSGSKEVSINIAQNDGETRATINRVWEEQKLYQGMKGLLIHINLDVANAYGHTISAIAYFFDVNGNPLKDSDNNYCTQDGQVSVNASASVIDDFSNWDDFKLFIPSVQLHTPKGGLKYYVRIYDEREKKFIGESDWQYVSLQ